MILQAYIYLWALGNLSRVLSLPGVELRYNEVVAAASVLAVVKPLSPAALLLSYVLDEK